MKIFNILSLFLLGLIFFVSCDKKMEYPLKDYAKTDDTFTVDTDGVQMRMAMQEDGYIETEVNPIEKIECYFEQWDKTIMTPVSGLFEYTDQNGTWVASIDFGDGTCDEWVTKTWDVNIFPDHPEGSEDFSVFKY